MLYNGNSVELQVVITPNPMRDQNLMNLKEIDLSSSYGEVKKVDFLQFSKNTPLQSVLMQLTLLISIAEAQIKQPVIQEFIKNEHGKFDLIILEQNSPLLYAFGEIFKCPMVK